MVETPPAWYQYAAKAVAAAAALGSVAFASLLVSLDDSSLGGSSVTTVEWVRLGIAVLGAVGGTYAVYKIPNDYGAAGRRAADAADVQQQPLPYREHLGGLPRRERGDWPPAS